MAKQQKTAIGFAANLDDAPATRLAVPRTAKMLVGGSFIRSESGRVYPATTPGGRFLANVPLASRKDARDAVRAARTGFGAWSSMTGYNRGQVLYRLAEMLDGRRAQFVAEIVDAEDVSAAEANEQVDRAVDRLVWFAGWGDKLDQVLGSVNPVTGSLSSVSATTGTGVVVSAARLGESLLGVVDAVAPVLVAGSSVIVLADPAAPLPAITFGEVVVTSDVPAGAVNVLTGTPAETLPWLASHADVQALDLSGLLPGDLATDAEVRAADTVKRVRRPAAPSPDDHDPGLAGVRLALEVRTVWATSGR